MFQSAFQGGQYVEVLNAKDAKNSKDNTEKKKFISNLVQFSQTSDYHFDPELKSFVLKMSNKSSVVSIPAQNNQNLSLVQPILVLQIKLPESNPWSITLILNDTNNVEYFFNRRPKEELASTIPYHPLIKSSSVCKYPPSSFRQEMPSFMAMFPGRPKFKHILGQTYRSLEGIIICSQCLIRRILTTRESNVVNNYFAYPTGLDHSNVEINLDIIRENLPELNEKQQIPIKKVKQLYQIKQKVHQVKAIDIIQNKKDTLSEEVQEQNSMINKHHVDSSKNSKPIEKQGKNSNNKQNIKMAHQPYNEFLDDKTFSENTYSHNKENQSTQLSEKKKPFQESHPTAQQKNKRIKDADRKQKQNNFDTQNDLIESNQLESPKYRTKNIEAKKLQQSNNNNSQQHKKKLQLNHIVIQSQELQQCVDNLDDIIADINGLSPSNQGNQEDDFSQEIPDQINLQIISTKINKEEPNNMVEMIYDPLFQCYIDIKTGEYFVDKV